MSFGSRCITNTQYRVVTPLLRSLPLSTNHDEAALSINREFGTEIDAHVFDILKTNGVILNQEAYYDRDRDPNKTFWTIASRESKELPFTSFVTILIVSKWTPDMRYTWHKSVWDLKEWIDGFMNSRGRPEVDIHVEMIAPELHYRQYFAPIFNRPDLDSDWPRIRAKVRRILESHNQTRTGWTCIALFRWGPNKYAEENPETVYVSMSRDCPEFFWESVQDGICEFLESTGHGLKFHMEHSAPDLYGNFEILEPSKRFNTADPLLAKSPYKEKVYMGADISASTYTTAEPQEGDEQRIFNSTVGTHGCYIQLQLKNKGPWLTFSLTNYHVVRPAIPGFRRAADGTMLTPEVSSVLRKADIHGFRPDNEFDIVMESPSRAKHNKTISFLKALMETEPEEHDGQVLKAHCEFFDKERHIFGRLYAGSGFAYRTTSGGILDWALIEVNANRIGDNKLPDRSIWPEDLILNRPPNKISGQPLRKPAPSFQISQRQDVYKIGARTKATTGMFSRHTAEVRYKDWSYLANENICQPTVEAAFVRQGAGTRFASAGDSGCVVYDSQGRGLGLLFRGQSKDEHDAFSYVTPLEDVLSHIASFLGLKRAQVRIAEF